MRSAFKMKGYSYPGKAPVKQKVDPDAPGTPGEPGYESEVKSTDYLTVIPNPTTKAIKSKSTLDDSSDHDMGNLEDKMRDEGVFSIGGQKND